jgi:hypothetical protein
MHRMLCDQHGRQAAQHVFMLLEALFVRVVVPVMGGPAPMGHAYRLVYSPHPSKPRQHILYASGHLSRPDVSGENPLLEPPIFPPTICHVLHDVMFEEK